jgi:phosphoribosyl-ATP pyrophosphohydrolase/phosphoribosyl-AMP cyclohydrolase/histidinol dehydrogenase
MSVLFARRSVEELVDRPPAISQPELVATVTSIVGDVRVRGEDAVREFAERFDGLEPGTPLVVSKAEMQLALDSLAPDERARLTRVAGRIRAFAEGQRRSLLPFELTVPGGAAGHSIAAVERAGCYAPGGRYPLPSSVLMTAITARAAGVGEVWVASPSRSPLMLACAALANADGFLAVGGAQAIAALAFGAGPVPPCDVVVGPGNSWVTAAKRLVFGHVGIDALAGPSELVVLADASADAAVIAADLLAQAEHDPQSIPILVTVSGPLADRVTTELASQLATLPAADIARAALANGGCVVVRDLEEGVSACDRLAPEHLHLHLQDATSIAARLRNYGALFIGSASAEVLGDYGAGPNHVLPTGRASRFSGGLSVLTFLRVRTWLAIHDAPDARELFEDAAWLGRAEGLEAHARSAGRRLN